MPKQNKKEALNSSIKEKISQLMLDKKWNGSKMQLEEIADLFKTRISVVRQSKDEFFNQNENEIQNTEITVLDMPETIDHNISPNLTSKIISELESLGYSESYNFSNSDILKIFKKTYDDVLIPRLEEAYSSLDVNNKKTIKVLRSKLYDTKVYESVISILEDIS